MILSGGLLRFERFGRIARTRGYQITFVRFSGAEFHSDWTSEFEVVDLQEALGRNWDFTMVPGAGFPLQTINQMEVLQNTNFGMRIQHILNDQSKRENFIKVNQSFRPHVVIFNNRHWEPGSFTEFQANRFHFLEGAVDPIKFAPSSYKKFPGPNEKK